jgi:DNA-binding NarL/FixJ family response regulator
MPVMDGPTCTRVLIGEALVGRVIAITTYDTDEHVFSMISAGASAFVLKDIEPVALIAAINVVNHGNALVAPGANPISSSYADIGIDRRTRLRPPRPKIRRTPLPDPHRTRRTSIHRHHLQRTLLRESVILSDHTSLKIWFVTPIHRRTRNNSYTFFNNIWQRQNKEFQSRPESG